MILPDVISKEPLGPVVRNNDLQWISVVRWVYFAMINAEELGVSSRTIDQALRSQKPEVKRLVGTTGDFGEEIGLTNAWAANVIRTVGNYGEVFERNLGAKTPLAIPRGLNQLWNEGGIQYAPPNSMTNRQRSGLSHGLVSAPLVSNFMLANWEGEIIYLDFLALSSRPGCRSRVTRSLEARVLPALTLSLHRRGGTGVSLLAIHAPVA